MTGRPPPGPRTATARVRPGSWWAAGAGSCLTVLLVSATLVPGTTSWLVLTRSAGLVAVAVFALTAARLPAGVRSIWWLLFAFQALTWTGDLVYDYHAYADAGIDVTALPSVPDVSTPVYLLGYLAAYGALAAIASGQRRAHVRTRVSIATLAVVTLASVALLATFVIAPLLVAAPAGGAVSWDSVLYPLLDVGLLALLLHLALDLDRWNLPLLLLGTALLVYLLADLAYTVHLLAVPDDDLPAWLESMFLAPLLLLALAVTAPGADRVATPSPGPPRVMAATAVLTVGALVVPVLILLLAWQRGDPLVAVLACLAAGVTGLVLWQVRSLLGRVAGSEEHYRLLVENTGDVVVLLDGDRIRWVSPSVADMLGWHPDHLVGRRRGDLIHPEDLVVATDPSRGDDAALPARFRVRTSDGDYRWVARTLRRARDASGTDVGVVASLRDIDVEVASERALARSEARFRRAMAAAPTGIAVIDSEFRFVDVNDALCRTLHRDRDWLVGRSIAAVVDAGSLEVLDRLCSSVTCGSCPSASGDLRLVTAGGRRRIVECSLATIGAGPDESPSFVYQVVDVTDAREALEGLEFLASHDPLTMLANRTQLLGHTRAALHGTPRTGSRTGIMFIDVDGLKGVNDTFGHALGDRLILTVADTIRSAVRHDDVTARVGGDEFVVLLKGLHHVTDALAVAAKIHRRLADTVAFTADGVDHHPSVSIGVALARGDDDPDSLLTRADQAMYRAKRTGPGRTMAAPDAVASDPSGAQPGNRDPEP